MLVGFMKILFIGQMAKTNSKTLRFSRHANGPLEVDPSFTENPVNQMPKRITN